MIMFLWCYELSGAVLANDIEEGETFLGQGLKIFMFFVYTSVLFYNWSGVFNYRLSSNTLEVLQILKLLFVILRKNVHDK